jgi:hypothetical protein
VGGVVLPLLVVLLSSLGWVTGNVVSKVWEIWDKSVSLSDEILEKIGSKICLKRKSHVRSKKYIRTWFLTRVDRLISSSMV